MIAQKKSVPQLPTSTVVFDELCRLHFGKPLKECPVGVSVEPVLTALDALEDELVAISKVPEKIEFFTEKDEVECDLTIASMVRTSSLDPFRFIPANSQRMVRMTIVLAQKQFMIPYLAKRRLRDIPAQLTGRSLGLAGLAVHVLRP